LPVKLAPMGYASGRAGTAQRAGRTARVEARGPAPRLPLSCRPPAPSAVLKEKERER